MICTKNLIKTIFIFILFTFNINAQENEIPKNIIDNINVIIKGSGYLIEPNNYSLKNNLFNLNIKSFNKQLNKYNLKYSKALISKDFSTIFLVQSKIKTKEKKNFRKIKKVNRILKQAKETSKYLRHSYPIVGEERIESLSSALMFSTTNAFIIPDGSNDVLLGQLIYNKNNNITEYSKNIILKKKNKELSIVNKLKNKYPDLILGNPNNKLLIMLYSLDCGYCNKMINNANLYNDNGYSLLLLPATELFYDLKYSRFTHSFFCQKNVKESFKNKQNIPQCKFPKQNEKLQDIYHYKKQLLGGINFVGTPFLFFPTQSLWYTGYIEAKSLKNF
jgi:hypothetical protein